MSSISFEDQVLCKGLRIMTWELLLTWTCLLHLGSSLSLPRLSELRSGPLQTQGKKYDRGYVITTPRRWSSNGLAQICVHLTGSESVATGGSITVFLNANLDEENEMQLITPKVITLDPGVSQLCDNISVPVINDWQVNMKIEGNFGISNVNYNKPITIGNELHRIFVQTDKFLYKPGQKVQFRILSITGPFLKISNTMYDKIWIVSPSGRRLAQWLNHDNRHRLIHLEFELFEEPEEGYYEINVQQGKTTGFKTFKVEEFVLPRYEVTIKPPGYILATDEKTYFIVCAKYTYGAPVKGDLFLTLDNSGCKVVIIKTSPINGCQYIEITAEEMGVNLEDCYVYTINAAATVIEEGTGVELKGDSVSARIFRTAITFKNEGKEKYMKPSLPFTGKVKAEFPDGFPAPHEPMSVCLGEMCYNTSTDAEGLLTFGVPPGSQETVQVKAINYPCINSENRCSVMSESSYEYYPNLMYSPSNSALIIRPPLGVLSCTGKTSDISLPIIYATCPPFNSKVNLHIQVVSRGQIQFVKSEEVEFVSENLPFFLETPEPPCQGAINGTLSINLQLPPTVSPKAKIIVWYVREDGEVVADTQEVEMQKCLTNDVDLYWSTYKVQPGEQATLILSAEPDSVCSLGVVDKSVELLSSDMDDLSIDRVFDMVESAMIREYENAQSNDWEYCEKKYKKDECKSLSPPGFWIPFLISPRCPEGSNTTSISIPGDGICCQNTTDECKSLSPPGFWIPLFLNSPPCPEGLLTTSISRPGGICCQDTSDSCGIHYIQCSNGNCIKNDWWCDGQVDCVDGLDERNCCFNDWFKCPNGNCIENTRLCDGQDDCRDGTDESNCCQGFQCFNGNCISNTWLCDGDDDCGDGTDENDCLAPQPLPPQSNDRLPRSISEEKYDLEEVDAYLLDNADEAIRHKRSVWRPNPYYSDYSDALQMFDNSGLYILSDLTVETRPCEKFENVWFSQDVRAFSLGEASPAVAAFSAPGGQAVQDDKPRIYFPETWLWDLTILHSGQWEQQLTLPDTITKWVGKAVCVHPQQGLGLSPPADIITFTPFFVDLTLPPTVKRGELLSVKISVFNYEYHDLPVKIILEPSEEYEIVSEKGKLLSEAGIRSSCVTSEDKTLHTIKIRPNSLGDINITVHATVDNNFTQVCSGKHVRKSDRLIKPIKVEAEGFPHEKTWTKYICSTAPCSKPRRKCRRKGGECIDKDQLCSGRIITKGCMKDDCKCCAALCGNPKGRCKRKGGECIGKDEVCSGHTIRKGCNKNRCKCCIACSEATDECQEGGGECIGRNEICVGRTIKRGCKRRNCKCCIAACSEPTGKCEKKGGECIGKDEFCSGHIISTECKKTAGCKCCIDIEEENYDFLERWQVEAPPAIVPDSARGWVTAVGDLLGPTLESLGSLVRMPYGCGEQNMLNFAPNIFILQYLEASNQITEEIEKKAKNYMNEGYHRELKYRHDDGSFSAFGKSDASGSTWLTAFVLKSFAQARQFIEVDEDDLIMSQDWLKVKQQRNGCFESVGKVFHKGMKGGIAGSGSQVPLTAYVLISLLEAGELGSSIAIRDAAYCLQTDKFRDPYTQALKAYALSLAKLPEAQSAVDTLLSMANNDSSSMSWDVATTIGESLSVAVETAGYAILAMMTLNAAEYNVQSRKIVKWISSQRNGQGGFISTQDTVVALQAMASFEASQDQGPVDMTVDVWSLYGETFPYKFTINETNKLLQQMVTLPSIPTNVTLGMIGSGCALLQAVLRYNVPEPDPSDAFSMNVSTETVPDSQCNTKNISMCTSYLLSDGKSNMAVIEFKLISGYIPEKEDLKQIVGYGSDLIKRYEVDDNLVTFYIDEISSKDICVSFRVTRDFDVEDAKPGTVRVYDYYQTEFSVRKSYTLPPIDECLFIIRDVQPISPWT